MAVTTVNTFGTSTLGVLGIRGYFRPTAGAGWVDLGSIKNWEPSDEIEELEISGARSGLTVVYETLPISAALSYGFDSENPNDTDILELWNGGAFAAGVDGDVSPISFQNTEGELMWVRENAQSTKPSQILFHPKANIRRDGQGGTPGEEASGLTFTVSVLADESYVIPAAVDAATPAAEYGYLYVVPTASLDAATTAAST